MKTVYLAGPITGLTFGEAEDGWRKEVQLVGAHPDIKYLSPLRGKDYLRSEGLLEKQYLHLSPLSSPQGIVRRDFNDVRTVDAVFACFLDDGGRGSIGTSWEMGVAYALQKPVVAVLKPGTTHDHPFITQTAAYTFDNVVDAVNALFYVLGINPFEYPANE